MKVRPLDYASPEPAARAAPPAPLSFGAKLALGMISGTILLLVVLGIVVMLYAAVGD